VVLAVVDPGVGSDRRRVAIEVGGGQSVLVGPDNGLLAPAVAMVGGATRAVSLTNPDYHLPAPGPTFDGRDVFAPVAAALCAGATLDDVGEEIDVHTLVPGLLPVLREDGDDLVGEVLWVDHFGNCQLNVDPDDIAAWGDALRLQIGGEWRVARRATSYGDIREGQVGLVVDSYGLVSVALDRMPADTELGLRAGAEVRLQRLDGDEAPAGATTPVSLGRKDPTP
jgi:S-adenosylmethionine hydrolase